MLQRWLEILALVLRILLWPLRRASTLLFPVSELDGLSSAVTAKAALQFQSYLRSLSPTSSSTSPAIGEIWSSNGFAAAKQAALESHALLLVYLHSPLHPQSRDFCQAVLNAPSMQAWLSQPLVEAVGYSIHSAQGRQLAQMLSVSSFPVLALLQPSRSSLSLLLRAEGPALIAWSMDRLLPHLQASATRHEVLLAEETARVMQREQEAELRRQQDAEYQQALQADRERERQRAAEQEQARLQEQEARDAIESARNKMGTEPSSGGTMVRFVLPSGVKLNRRFAEGSSIATLKAYLTVYCHENGVEMSRIGLSTSFPRQTYNDNDDVTLEEAGLSPQAVLMVQDLDA